MSDETTIPSSASQIPEPPARLRGRYSRLFFSFIPATVGFQLVWGGVSGILLPLQVQSIDPENRIASLALVSTIGAFLAMVSQPLAGVVSDRLRTRFGRRAPMIIVGTVVGGLALIGMGFSTQIWQIAVAWACVQLFFNAAQGPFTAVIPDRVPRNLRGSFSAIYGAMQMVGGIAGAVLAGTLGGMPSVAFVTIAVVAFVFVGLFVVLNPDSSSRDLAVEPFSLRKFASAFWVNPVRHPDFFWAFSSRLLLYSGYFAVTGYNLYLLQDYVGLGQAAPGLVAVVAGVGLPGLVISIAIFGPLSDKVKRRKPFVVFAAAVVAVGMIVPWVSPTLTGMVVMSVVVSFGFGAFQAVDTALVTEVLPSQTDYGKDIGIINIAATLPQTVAPALAGAVVLGFGFAGLFPVAILLSILGALLVLPIRSVR